MGNEWAYVPFGVWDEISQIHKTRQQSNEIPSATAKVNTR